MKNLQKIKAYNAKFDNKEITYEVKINAFADWVKFLKQDFINFNIYNFFFKQSDAELKSWPDMNGCDKTTPCALVVKPAIKQ